MRIAFVSVDDRRNNVDSSDRKGWADVGYVADRYLAVSSTNYNTHLVAITVVNTVIELRN